MATPFEELNNSYKLELKKKNKYKCLNCHETVLIGVNCDNCGKILLPQLVFKDKLGLISKKIGFATLSFMAGLILLFIGLNARGGGFVIFFVVPGFALASLAFLYSGIKLIVRIDLGNWLYAIGIRYWKIDLEKSLYYLSSALLYGKTTFEDHEGRFKKLIRMQKAILDSTIDKRIKDLFISTLYIIVSEAYQFTPDKFNALKVERLKMKMKLSEVRTSIVNRYIEEKESLGIH